MGRCYASRHDVMHSIEQLESEWAMGSDDIFGRNCCVFCNELCIRLGVGGIPDWVMNLAGVGAVANCSMDDAIMSLGCCCSRKKGASNEDMPDMHLVPTPSNKRRTPRSSGGASGGYRGIWRKNK